jgi:hypothetical protein
MGLSGAERQARWRVKRAKEVEELRKAAAGGKTASALPQELAQARATIEWLRQQLAAASRQGGAKPAPGASEKAEIAAAPKPPKPQLDPDSAAARTIKGLQTRAKNLQNELAHTRDLLNKVAMKHGHMDFKTSSLISKALHSDNGTPSAELLEEAFKAFNAWKADNKATRHH